MLTHFNNYFYRVVCLCLLVTSWHALHCGEHNHPVGANDGIASFDVFVSGSNIYQLSARAIPSQPCVIEYRLSENNGSSWSPAITIDIGAAPHRPVRTSDIQIAAHGDQVIAAWSVAGTGFMGSGPIVTAISHDGGKSWSRGTNPADDNSTGGHNFVDITADQKGRFHAAWLDNRSGKQGLIYSASDDGGRTWSTNRVLDPITCECCWNTIFAHDDAVHILFRASSPRDMRLFSSHDRGATFSDGITVGSFNWSITACPHVGGALSGTDSDLHAVVWTGADGKAGVYHLVSSDHGATWSTPHPFPVPRARQATVSAHGNRVVVATTAFDDSGPGIWVQISNDKGITWDLPERISPPDAQVAHPKAISTSTGTVIFWTQQLEKGAWTLEQAIK